MTSTNGIEAKPTLLDRLFLINHKITGVVKLTKTLSAFYVNTADVRLILKFAYAGNIQYHKLDKETAAILLAELENATSRDQDWLP